jgi:hypothetical protein
VILSHDPQPQISAAIFSHQYPQKKKEYQVNYNQIKQNNKPPFINDYGLSIRCLEQATDPKDVLFYKL